MVEIIYTDDMPEFAAGAFLPEEAELIIAVAREIALFIERREADEEKAKLNQQLIHADRLATIGQLAAGVAHELNEPLASILGFSQLIKKYQDLPQPAEQDVERIITASLYAREVIKNLMVFSRQLPARKNRIDLNQVIEDGLYFLEARCEKDGIKVIRNFDSQIPEIVADPSQIKQILVNLVVNAVQAMPNGGSLTISTKVSDGFVVFSVADSGTGIGEDLREKIFLPFFTTKDVDEGTGLGLAVVHGIVSSHGGSISIESQPGLGARFDISMPVTGLGKLEGAAENDNKSP
jgi:signal transduction histidine kinase